MYVLMCMCARARSQRGFYCRAPLPSRDSVLKLPDDTPAHRNPIRRWW